MQVRKSDGYNGSGLFAKGSDPFVEKIPYVRISNKMKEICNEQIFTHVLIFI